MSEERFCIHGIVLRQFCDMCPRELPPEEDTGEITMTSAQTVTLLGGRDEQQGDVPERKGRYPRTHAQHIDDLPFE